MPSENVDTPESKTTQLTADVRPEAEGFSERITPKPLPDNVFLLKCACGGVHFRHAGYVDLLLPYVEPQGKRVGHDSTEVHVCVACKTAYIWASGQVYDVTDRIDLAAWERTEVEAHAATGPGGQC